MTDVEYSRRTVITGLTVDPADEQRLRDLIDEWNRGCQIAVNLAWGVCHTRSDVQQLAYDELRERTDLGSQHAVLATHRAARAIQRSREHADDASKPTFTAPSAAYDSRTMTLFDDRSVSLSTTDSRIEVTLSLPADADGYQYRYLDDDRWELRKSTLHYRDGAFDLHLGFRAPRPDVDPSGGDAVLGVGLGAGTFAATSTAEFFSDGELAHRYREFEDAAASLAQVGTRNAERVRKRNGYRVERFLRHRLHAVSNDIVAEATAHGCVAIAFGDVEAVVEDLPDAGSFHAHLFETLYEYVAYKAAEWGIDAVEVNPEYTTQRCSECGFTHPQNRDTERRRFECLKCGNEVNETYNAAKNVALRCVRNGPLSSDRFGATYVALRSGWLTADGEFVSDAPVETIETKG